MKRSTLRPRSQAVLAGAVLATSMLATYQASAASFGTLYVTARPNLSGTYSSSLTVTPGATYEYQVRMILNPSPVTNTLASNSGSTGTLTSWDYSTNDNSNAWGGFTGLQFNLLNPVDSGVKTTFTTRFLDSRYSGRTGSSTGVIYSNNATWGNGVASVIAAPGAQTAEGLQWGELDGEGNPLATDDGSGDPLVAGQRILFGRFVVATGSSGAGTIKPYIDLGTLSGVGGSPVAINNPVTTFKYTAGGVDVVNNVNVSELQQGFAGSSSSDPEIAFSPLSLFVAGATNAVPSITIGTTPAKSLVSQSIAFTGVISNGDASAMTVNSLTGSSNVTITGPATPIAVAGSSNTNYSANLATGTTSGTSNFSTSMVANPGSVGASASKSIAVYDDIAPVFGNGAGIVVNTASGGALQAVAQVTTGGTHSNLNFAFAGLNVGTNINPGASAGTSSITDVSNLLNGVHKDKIAVGIGYADTTIYGSVTGDKTTVTGTVTQLVSGNLTPNTSTAFGTAQTAFIHQGDTAAGMSATAIAGSGSLGTTAALLDSTAYAGDGTASVQFRQRFANEQTPGGTSPPLPTDIVELVSDVVKVGGLPSTGSDKYVLQLSYNDIFQGTELAAIDSGKLYMAWLNGGQWEQVGTGAAKLGNYDPLSDFSVGEWGVNTTTNNVWAVMAGTQQGDFAVVPEPASLGLLALGALGLLRRRK